MEQAVREYVEAQASGVDNRNKVLTPLHEYAHELLHRGEGRQRYTRQVKECHAEAAAYIVAHYLDIHNPFSADYLQSWGNTPGAAADRAGPV